MKKNRVLEPFSIPIPTGHLLDSFNACILGFQHAIIPLKPFGIKNSPEIATHHAQIFSLKAESCRMKERLQIGTAGFN
jgi:hypothetical protein